MANNNRNTCVPAHSRPSPHEVCRPYVFRENGVCSNIIGDRLVYASKDQQENLEEARNWFRGMTKGQISEKCYLTVEQVYCNQYFQRCDNADSKILSVPVCREACDIMVQQHCKEEWSRTLEINKNIAATGWRFHMINCTTLPRRNGGTIPECYFPRELEENITREDFDVCSYGDGQSYRGNVSVTRSGYTCQSWSSQCPHRHQRTPDNFPEVIDAGNACRNPGGQAPHGPWCYTTNASVRWEYCDISTCAPEDASLLEWSPFTNCSVTCGTGFKTRYRTCSRPRFGGKDCASLGSLTEQQPCNVHNCSGLTFTEIAIVSAGGSVLFILVATLVAVLIKRHKRRHPNIPDRANEEEIAPYATVHISGIFALQAEINGHDPPDMFDNPQEALPLQPGTSLQETSAGVRDLLKLPYQNIDHLGRPSVNPLEYLFFQPRYENEVVDNEARDVMIRPGYDKLTLTQVKRRENGGAQLGRRLPGGLVDKDGLPVYDLLNREIHVKPESQKAEITDSEIENDVKTHAGV